MLELRHVKSGSEGSLRVPWFISPRYHPSAVGSHKTLTPTAKKQMDI